MSHVGQNSLYEAAYRGVPLVAIPLFADQPDNAKLAEFRGFGLSLDYFKLNADELHSTIEHVMKNPRYVVLLYPFLPFINISTIQFIHFSLSSDSVKTLSAFHT